jgi:hypothetical protein
MTTKTLVPQKLIKCEAAVTETVNNDRDCIIYALGIGFSKDPLDDYDLSFTYELH